MLEHSKHALEPEDLLIFYELKWFERDWDDLNLPEEELARLQIVIMCDPTAWPVIKGTNGLRKLRFAPSTWKTGKSGGLRICYVYFEQYYTVLLVVVYRKGEQDTLPAAAKRAINREIDRVERELAKRFQQRRV